MEVNSEVWSKFPINVFGEIPKYIKNCLQRTSFDTLATIQTIKSEDFAEIEETLRFDSTFKTESESEKDFFHIFADNVDNFKFVLGHRRLIIKMAEFATKILENSVPEPEKKRDIHPNPAQVYTILKNSP